MQRTKVCLVLMIAVAGTCLVSASPARADCLLPPVEVLWSYPADGQKDVPTNASFWVLGNRGDFTPPVSATLNGKELERLVDLKPSASLGLAAFAPLPLTPRTSYTLRFSYDKSDNHPARSFAVHFETGTGESARLGESTIGEHQRRAGVYVEDHPCKKIIMAPNCLATPEPTVGLHTLELTQPGAIAWYVAPDGLEGMGFWPAACGNPTLAWPAMDGRRCFEVKAIAADGTVSSPKRYCIPETDSIQPFGRASAPAYTGPVKAAPPEHGGRPEASAPGAPAESDGPRHEAPRRQHEGNGCGGCQFTTDPTTPFVLGFVLLLARRRIG